MSNRGIRLTKGMYTMLQSTKMENLILAPVNGTVTKIGLSVGQLVEVGHIVAIIEY